MKTSLIIILSLAYTLSAIGQTADSTVVKKEYYKNGNIKRESFYTSDKHNCIIKEYYEGGGLMMLDTIIDGIEKGILKGYYENGKLRFEIPFINENSDVGIVYTTKRKVPAKEIIKGGKIYFGNRKFDLNYYKIGNENGVVKDYYESGILSSEAPFLKGKGTGVWKWYYPDGKLQEIEPFTNGRQGWPTYYDENGNEIKK